MNNDSEFFERFLCPANRGFATNELAQLGEEAIPILNDLFSGKTKNRFGVPYRQIGTLGCAYVTVGLLGPTAKALEKFVREGIQQGEVYAIEAAGYLGEIEETTACALAQELIRNPFGSEAGASLVRCNQHTNPVVLSILGKNSGALYTIKRAEEFLFGD